MPIPMFMDEQSKSGMPLINTLKLPIGYGKSLRVSAHKVIGFAIHAGRIDRLNLINILRLDATLASSSVPLAFCLTLEEGGTEGVFNDAIPFVPKRVSVPLAKVVLKDTTIGTQHCVERPMIPSLLLITLKGLVLILVAISKNAGAVLVESIIHARRHDMLVNGLQLSRHT